MFHVDAGSFRFVVDNKAYDLASGQTLLVSPGVEHSYTNETKKHGKYSEIKFSATSPISEDSRMQITDSQLVSMLFHQIIREYADLNSLADEPAAAYLSALLQAMQQDRRYQKRQSPQFRHVDASGYSELSQKIIHYLESHYSKDLSLDDLALAMDYNKSYLCVAFKKDTRQTILDCLNMIRIRKAAELIVYSDHSLSQVAEMCGFSSVSHFNRVFLKYAGITPGQCRRAYPPNILFSSKNQPRKSSSRSNAFMFNALAQKRITLDMIHALDDRKSQTD